MLLSSVIDQADDGLADLETFCAPGGELAFACPALAAHLSYLARRLIRMLGLAREKLEEGTVTPNNCEALPAGKPVLMSVRWLGRGGAAVGLTTTGLLCQREATGPWWVIGQRTREQAEEYVRGLPGAWRRVGPPAIGPEPETPWGGRRTE